MNDILLWRKIARIIVLLAQRLGIETAQAMNIFYTSRVCKLLHNQQSGLQLMSDAYVIDEIIMELQHS
jgi:hypothetical protein